jgi:hypothetical protein
MGKHTIRARGISTSENSAKKNRSIYTVLKSPVPVNINKDMCSIAVLIRITNLYESITGVDHNRYLKPYKTV